MSTLTEKNYLDKLKLLILAHTKNYPVKVFLFGSHAKNTTHRYSDIDIAILPIAPLPMNFISELKEKIEESTIPYHVDVVDLLQTDENFRDKVLKEGIIWKD
jgi:predicted nucleotidyltransferase